MVSPTAANVHNTKGPTNVVASPLNSRQAELERCMPSGASVDIGIIFSRLHVEGHKVPDTMVLEPCEEFTHCSAFLSSFRRFATLSDRNPQFRFMINLEESAGSVTDVMER